MQSLTLQKQNVESSGRKTIVENAKVGFHQFVGVPGTPSVSSVDLTLVPPLSTPPVVNQAVAHVVARAPARATIGSVAQVRAAQGDAGAESDSLVIDFQAQRTVSELAPPGPVGISSVAPWLGTKFGDPAAVTITSWPDGSVSFDELQTERLLVQLDQAQQPDVFATGSVVIPTPPSNLELLVNGTRVWFNAGPAVGPGGGQFSADVDVTDGVATAAAAAAARRLPVVLTLRASVPGVLELTGVADLLERYVVAFPEGAVRAVEAPSEGVYTLTLPISTARVPVGEDTWQIKRILLDATAKIPPARVLPPDGPAISPDAELLLDAEHAFAVRLPPESTAQLATLSGVRVPLRVGDKGIEVAGTLLSGTKCAPGEALPKGQIGPVKLPPPLPTAPANEPTWVDLPLVAPVKLDASVSLWLELQVARGSAVWPVGAVEADKDHGALLQRKTANGRYAGLSTVTGSGSPSGVLRVVGAGHPNEPLAAVVMALGDDAVGGVPTPNGTTMILGLARALELRPAAGGSDSQVELQLTISTPGSYAITSAELQYTSPTTSEALR